MSLTVKAEKWQKIRETYKNRRVFRIWLLGNPEELGYKNVFERYSNEWYYAVSFVAHMIHESIPDKETFAGTFLEWFGDTLYLAEAYPTGLIFTEAYKKFYRSVKDSDLSFLKKNHKFITEYAIPKNGEPRKIFDRALKVYMAMLKKREEKSKMIKKHLESIKFLL